MRDMNTMGTENCSSNFPQRPSNPPFPPPPQFTSHFSLSSPVVGSEASAFRPGPPGVAQSSRPFSSSGPVTGQQNFGLRPVQTSRPSSPFVPPSSSYGPPPVGTFQRYPSPQFSPTVQPPPPPTSAPGKQSSSPFRPPGQLSSSPVSFRPQSQMPSMPMGSPTHTMNQMPSVMNIPPSASPRYPSNPIQPPPAGQSSPFGGPQAGYGMGKPLTTPLPYGQQRGYATPPPVAAPYGAYSRVQMQHGVGPPMGTVQDVMADFSFLSLASVPGSGDAGLDPKALPRPLDGDVEPKAFADLFPLNCNPRYLRLTTSAIPASQALVSRWHLPLGAVVCPLAEAPEGEEVPIVNFASTGIIRCRRCRTYVNPYVTFTDGGRKWRCNMCALLNDVPGDYFSQLDANGRRLDLNERPELTKGSVEFLAPTEYMLRPPMPPLYLFMIDVSISAVRSGMLGVVAETIKSCLDRFPGFPRTQIGFITFDSTIHFYNMKSSLTQPQMMVVSELDDIFIPLPDDLLVNLSESRTVVDAFLDSLPSMFQDNMNVESAFGPALKAAYMVMSQLGGKLLIFQNTLPSLGVGRLKLRGEDVRVYGTDKEHALRIPEDPFYKQMAADCTKFQIAVNIYAFSDKYTDIASLGTLAKYTGGQLNYYPNFNSDIHKEKLRHELARDITRETAWESVMRIRCGKGVKFTSYHGHFMLRSTDLLALPAVDCDKAYAMQMTLEETLLTSQLVYFQVALLYTSSSGERRIRVHTAAAPVVTELGEMYRQADTGSIVCLLSRIAIEKSQSSKLEEARNTVQQRIVKALREYRNVYAAQNRLGKMIYPESLKYLPLYGLALSKATVLRGGYADVQLDERCAAGHTIMNLPIKKLLKLLYPNLLRADDFLLKASSKAYEFNISRLPLTAESLDSGGLYIYDDGLCFVVWFGSMSSPDLAMCLLGENFGVGFSKNLLSLSLRDNEVSRKLFALLEGFRDSDPSYYQLCHLVRQGEQLREGFFLLANLVEDQVGGTNGYLDWTLQVHRLVQQNA